MTKIVLFSLWLLLVISVIVRRLMLSWNTPSVLAAATTFIQQMAQTWALTPALILSPGYLTVLPMSLE